MSSQSRSRRACSIRQDSRRGGLDAFRKLDPRALVRNPVIFVTEVVAALVTVFFVRDLVTA